MILFRYLGFGILVPTLAAMALLTLVFAAYSATGILADAVAGRVPGDAVLALVGLRCLIAAEVLLPTAFFLATVWAFTRLDRDSELTVMLAAGFNGARLVVLVMLPGLLVALVVSWLSLQARPWAYRMSYQLEAQVVPEDVAALEARRFYHLAGNMTLFADRVERTRANMRDVFAQRDLPAGTELIRADEFHLARAGDGDERLLEFRRGRAWRINRAYLSDRIHDFDVLRYRTVPPSTQDAGATRRRARPLASLLTSDSPRDLAEWQWRLLIGPLSLLMALVAMRIGQGRPREGVYGRLVTAVVVYIAVFNLAAMARTWVENGVVGALPGVWWVLLVPPALMLLLSALRRT